MLGMGAEKSPTAAVKTDLGKITSKGKEVVLMQKEGKRHHQEHSWERYLKRLKAGNKKPTIDGCKKALEKVPLDSQQEAELKYYLGRAYLMSKQFAIAETAYHHALALYERLNLVEGKSPICSDLGYIYAVQGNLEEAEKQLHKAIEIDKHDVNGVRLAIDYGRLAVVYLQRKEFAKAEEAANRSLRLAEQHKLQEEAGRQCGNLGSIYLEQHKLDQAERILEKGLVIDEALDRPIGIACKYYNLGLVYSTRQNLSKARECWQTAKPLFEKLGFTHMVHKIEELLANIDEYNL